MGPFACSFGHIKRFRPVEGLLVASGGGGCGAEGQGDSVTVIGQKDGAFWGVRVRHDDGEDDDDDDDEGWDLIPGSRPGDCIMKQDY